MAIFPFQRLVSNTGDVFLGIDRDQAAVNAANNTGDHPDAVARRVNPPTWPSLQKFDNDTTAQPFSPFGSVPNPEYIWDQPTSDGQTVAFAIASNPVTVAEGSSFSVSLSAFADNAMEAKIEMFEEIGGTFVKTALQPSGLGDFLLVAGEPNNPAVGLTIDGPPFTFQNIRVYSTRFTVPSSTTLKIVVSFEVTNYLIQPIYSSNPSDLNNPAGLQFMVDIYSQPECPQQFQACENTPRCSQIRNALNVGTIFDPACEIFFVYSPNNATFSEAEATCASQGEGFRIATTEEVECLAPLFTFEDAEGQTVGCSTLIWVLNNGEPSIARIHANCVPGAIEIFQFPGITEMCRADTICVFPL